MTSPDQPSGDAHGPSPEGHDAARDTGRPTARHFLPRHVRGWLWITLSVTAAAGVSAALIAVATRGGTPRASGGPPAAATAAPRPASGTVKSHSGTIKSGKVSNGASEAKGNVVSPAKLAESGGALSLPERLKKPAFRWASGPGGEHLAAVSAQFGAALQASGIRQYPEMNAACIQLAGSVATAEAGPKIPDAAMQTLYAQALAELAKGAADCRAAITVKPSGDESLDIHIDATLLRQSLSELAAGARDIFRSTAEIEIVSRQAH